MIDSQHVVRLIRRLNQIADIGIVNAREDVQTLRDAAEALFYLDERIAIMTEHGPGTGQNNVMSNTPETDPETHI